MVAGVITTEICFMWSWSTNDEHGNMYIVVDMELKGRIRAALIKAILGFEVRVK